jgi:hypothetical protein
MEAQSNAMTVMNTVVGAPWDYPELATVNGIQCDDKLPRFTALVKPEQSGKTFIMIQNIIAGFTEPMEGKRVVNIILCDNNLLLTKQTGERVKTDLEPYEVNGELYLELSSHKRTIYHEASKVGYALITNPMLSNILCCTNSVRTDDIYTIICDLNKSEYTKDKFFFKIWLDEADKFTGYIDNTFKPLVDEFDNIELNCITATPKKLFDKYKSINVIPIETTTCPAYHGWDDNVIRLVDHNASTTDFVAHILTNVASDLVRPGTKWFIPADHKKTSHEMVKDICVEKGFAVIIVNGDGIQLTLPDKQFFLENKDDELNKKVMELYSKHSLERFPLAITGNICIGRGLTILSKDFMIDYGILSSCHNQQEASQISGRLKGNIKNWSTYKKPIVFTTPRFDRVAREWEKKSRNLAELAYRKEAAGESTVITKNEFKTLGENYEYKVEPTLFKSFTEAHRFLNTKSREMGYKPKIVSKKSVIHKVDGYAITSKLLKAGQTVEDLTADCRITLEKSKTITPGSCISSTGKGSKYLILPIYETMETAANKEKYQVRYISYKN